jgi:glycosyltransferase involved in cell wall biosynthesis
LVREYQEKYKNIRYQRNKENIGAIRNVLQLPDLARGEYVWYMSDDDMFSDGAFSTMLPLLED